MTLDDVLKQVKDLPALPHVILKVVKMAAQPEVSAREIGQVIAQDPSFSVRLLKLANSSFYGLPQAVSTITDAVAMLGHQSVRNMALAAATQDVLSGSISGYDLEAGDLWRHSLACAYAAEMLAVHSGYPESEEAFVAGLLHDVGKVVIGMYVEGAVSRIQHHMTKHSCTFIEAERSVLGFDHAEVGGRIASHWNLPSNLVQAISWHHQPVRNGKLCPLAGITHIANGLCLIAGIGLGTDGLCFNIDPTAYVACNLDNTTIDAMIARLVETITEQQPFFASKKAA
ncbi:HDOD domain-containing protein [Nostoc sp. CHAB 5824]|nr:HDOD domain-containing protein [Nostoc sp. CHAB 5824]